MKPTKRLERPLEDKRKKFQQNIAALLFVYLVKKLKTYL